MEYLLTGAEMAECDRRTSEEIGIPSLVLMERAALSVADGADAFLKRSAARRPVVLAAAGRGNNGADALAAGRILLDRGYDVRFCRLSGEISPESSFAVQEKILEHYGVRVEPFPECEMLARLAPGAAEAENASGTLSREVPDLIIDGLFGTGLSRPLQGEPADAVRAVNRCREEFGTYVVAVDIPSGISSEDGRVMGCAVRCDETRTFAFYKRGHFLYPGSSYAGACFLAQIGITARALTARPGMFTFLRERAKDLLPARDPGGNKGTFGKVLIVAGRRNMCGAALMAARACMASGAGMVRIFTHEANRTIVQETLPEALLETFGEDQPPEEAAEKLRASMAWADVVAAGPAMGTDATAFELLYAVLQAAADPDSRLRGLVLDADAIRILARSSEMCRMLAGRNEEIPCVLTPHMGEFAALTGLDVPTCAEQRVFLVRQIAEELRCTVACKDARTLVAAWKMPSGAYLNTSGNSGMATAGSGDVLTGMTAAYLALFTAPEQSLRPVRRLPAPHGRGARPPFAFSGEDRETGFAAACCAVYLHGLAGDMAAALHGESSMTATDLIGSLRSAAFPAWTPACAEEGSNREGPDSERKAE